jgi:antimicrobial peptide system SdpA family protein
MTSFVLIVVFWITVFTVVGSLSLPYNPASDLFPVTSNDMRRLLPEGFGFFTRDAREPLLLIYEKKDNGVKMITMNNTTTGNVYGLVRSHRAFGIEVANLMSLLGNDKTWHACGSNGFIDCMLTSELPVVALEKPVPYTFLCGEYYLVETERLPWAWSEIFDQKNMPSKILRVSISCE